MVTDGDRLIVVIILQCTQILNHYTVHLKLTVLYVNYTSLKKKKKKNKKGQGGDCFYFSSMDPNV